MRGLRKDKIYITTFGAVMRNIVLGLAAFWTFAATGKAEVVYNNLANSSSSVKTYTSIATYAQRFTATSAFSGIESLKLNLFKSGGGNGSFFIYLKAGGTTPGVTLETLVINASVSALGTTKETFYEANNIAIGTARSAGDYWIQVSSTNAGSDLNWAEGATNIANNPSASSPTDENPTWTGGGISLGGQISVPEPGTLLLGGIAACSGAAGAWWKRRKRKATQPENTDQPATA